MEQQFNKKIYKIKDFFRFIEEAFRTMKYLHISRKKKEINDLFKSRLMLSVTEVNGCKACSWAHTGIALKEGMHKEDIHQILSGNRGNSPLNERTAILFAQHYADTGGMPDMEAWNTLVNTYGKAKSLGILGVIRIIMVGNVYGIGFGALQCRMRGKPVKESNFLYELGILFSIIPFIIGAPVTVLIKNIRKQNLILHGK